MSLVNITVNQRPCTSGNSGKLPITDWATADVRRFWSHVRILAPDACWLWQGPVIGSHGYKYGQFFVALSGRPRALYAHRIAYALTYGPLAQGHVACHRCDTTQCCNPSHLFAGTQGDNVRDASRKGHLQVPRPTAQKVSTDDLKEVDRLLSSGSKKIDIARRFGVSKTWVTLYASGQRRQYDRPQLHTQKRKAS